MDRGQKKPSAAPSNLTAVIVMLCLLAVGAGAVFLASRWITRVYRKHVKSPPPASAKPERAEKKPGPGLPRRFREALEQAMRMKELQRERMEEIQRRIEEVERGGEVAPRPSEPPKMKKRLTELERALAESEAARRAAERRLKELEKPPETKPPPYEEKAAAQIREQNLQKLIDKGADIVTVKQLKDVRDKERMREAGERKLRASYEKVKNQATVYLKNRGVFRGEIFRETPRELWMRVSTDDAGDVIEIQFSKNEISRIDRPTFEEWKARQEAP